MKSQKNEMKTSNLLESDWQMWGIPLCSRDKSGVLRIVGNWLDFKQKNKWIATVNPEFMMKTTKDSSFLALLSKTDLNVIDGIGLIWAREIDKKAKGRNIICRLLIGFQVGVEILKGKHREGLASGSDLVNDFCQLAAEKGYPVYFLGGWEDRAERTAKYFKNKYPKLEIRGFYAGKAEGEDEKTIKKIGQKRIDFLFVAYGMRKQEEWIERNIKKLNVGVAMGIGRSFDYYSGDLKRAPLVWRKIGMEWLYSLIQEPKRWRRQLELPKFVWKVLFT
ncbi:MAG: WecB/TagA/CpsF family glycosyltransferase [Candidatus Shapirobacteria bacterium]